MRAFQTIASVAWLAMLAAADKYPTARITAIQPRNAGYMGGKREHHEACCQAASRLPPASFLIPVARRPTYHHLRCWV